MYEKDHEFNEKHFQKTRRSSNREEIRESFGRIARYLNHVSRDEIPIEGLNKVCLILMNNFNSEQYDKYDPQIGPLNDGYLVALIHHRLGFKVFYLHNCKQGNYPKWVQFFMTHTSTNLTVFYSGHNADGIEFKDKKVTNEQISKLINGNDESKCKTLFISDCSEGGSVFNIENTPKDNSKRLISLSIEKSYDPKSKESKRIHGIFTYYLCKFIYDQPNISPKRISQRMESSLKRFNSRIICETNNEQLQDQPIFEYFISFN